MRKVRPLADRFWPKVSKAGSDECWEWQGSKDQHGYGKISVCTTNGARPRHASRVSWELNCGPIPQGLHVLHKCDNPPCVNPAHLMLGTAADNIHDMLQKRRHPAKVTPEIARKILDANAPQRTLAKQFGVSQATIGLVKRKELWSARNAGVSA